MMQFLVIIASLVACVLCNTYRPPSYGSSKTGGAVTTGFGEDDRRFTGRGVRRGSGFSRQASGGRIGSILDDVVSSRRHGGGVGFDDFVSGRGVGSGVGGRFGGRDVGFRGNDEFVGGRWSQGSSRWSDRRDDRWRDTRGRQQSRIGGVQIQPIKPAKLYN